jgi:hypothetical protein
MQTMPGHATAAMTGVALRKALEVVKVATFQVFYGPFVKAFEANPELAAKAHVTPTAPANGAYPYPKV